MKNYNLIWDFDGNLYDTYPVMMQAYKKSMSSFNVDITKNQLKEDYKFCKLYSFKELFKKNESRYGIEAKIADAKYHEIEQIMQYRPHFFPNADEVLKKLSSLDNRNFLLTHRDESAIGFLKEDNLKQYFEDFVTSKNKFKRKPDPEAINYFISKYDMDPALTFMIGDRDLDLLAGINAGIKSIYFNVDNFNDNRNASYVINNLSEIIDILK
ncbi:HAD-IA family hydrolase [Companilactobacillus sp. DQM5]|uniref:HAD-IA family hydrolase n=1 Tax=Companilactobacillus sp. DQM5 TaxID=3463359 RepID=UPI0040590FD1